MPIENSIPAGEFCSIHQIEATFIESLGDAGLFETSTFRETGAIPFDQLAELEKFIRLHQELEINLPGIEAIAHLLERIYNMRQEIINLRNRLNRYETGEKESGEPV